ncbi:reactive chlorine resistance membrane protein RclC [Flavobacterium sp. 2]|uniref:reactive chlorine resistance membrane protein RclC n=1 Tax=Flavobacterium sp. 2 TaxID=308053 RepID=UPI000C188772|nr:reactive chlorine resistance membrane protein RclC [Flavobacterium sp. 2]PIF60273.1 putative membrane protein YkgB [Flavobacterium sp. 2]
MKILIILSKLQGQFINFMRIAILIVMVWIGGLKAFQYEADGIVPFVANSPLMSFFYNNPQEYKEHKNKEGEMVQKNIEWNHQNGTYSFSYALGTAIVIIGALTFLGIFNNRLGLVGGLLTAGMALVTLTFLITTPETWVPNLGGDLPTPQFGFPYLSGAGRLVVKDIIMMAGGLIVASDSAKKLLKD